MPGKRERPRESWAPIIGALMLMVVIFVVGIYALSSSINDDKPSLNYPSSTKR